MLQQYTCDYKDISIQIFYFYVLGNPRRTTRRRPATTSTQFKISLSALINNLNTKNLHFVRCIKPNDLKQPRIFNTSLVEQQIDYQG